MAPEFYRQGSFLCLDGPAKEAGLTHSKIKVCFVCRDQELLRRLLHKLAQDDECYYVKMTANSRDEMFLGRAFFTAKERVGQVWAKYKNHPRIMATLQDDDFASAFRKSVFSWKDRLAEDLG